MQPVNLNGATTGESNFPKQFESIASVFDGTISDQANKINKGKRSFKK